MSVLASGPIASSLSAGPNSASVVSSGPVIPAANNSALGKVKSFLGLGGARRGRKVSRRSSRRSARKMTRRRGGRKGSRRGGRR